MLFEKSLKQAAALLLVGFLLLGRSIDAAGAPLSDLDSLRYIASYGDLIQAFGADPAKGRSHYEQYGAKEGRKISFDPNRYMASHPDLIRAFAGDEEQATRHYIEWGFKEGRQFSFDPLAYIASYTDLLAAFAMDAFAGAKHYILWGFNEGRQILFDAMAYLAKYADLRAAFGSDLSAATQHFINWGSKEGRTSPQLAPVALDLRISRTEATYYQTAMLRWSAENAQSCVASGDWSGQKPAEGRLDLPNDVTYEKSYSLTCSNPRGAVTKTVSVSVKPIELSLAGSWRTIRETDVTNDYNGTLANTFHGIVRIGSEKRYGLVSIGWGYSGFGETAKTREAPRIQASLFAPDANGLLKNADQLLTPNSLTNGGGSVVVTDFNEDGFEDLILLAQNESPFIALPSTVFWGSASGQFTKETLPDKVMAHDAQLVTINGKKTVMTGTFTVVKNDKGEWVKQEDALVNPFYTYENGRVRIIEQPVMKRKNGALPSIGGMTNTIVAGGNGYPAKLVSGNSNVANSQGQCCLMQTAIWDFVGNDIIDADPSQIFMPYLGSLARFKDLESIGGKGIPHVYRVFGRELSYDGHMDLLVAQSLWTQANNDWPSALQVMLNDGRGKLVDRTEALNPDMPLLKSELGYAPTFIDLDGSGIETMLWDGSFSWGDRKRFSDYLILNDGTGRLYLGLHPEFFQLGTRVTEFLKKIDPGYGTDTAIRFVGVPQSDGSVNYVAITPSQDGLAPGKSVQSYRFINVPLRYDPRRDFVKDVTVSTRNGSQRIRTWAGDDTIFDRDAGATAMIDGGLGRNRVVYAGPSSAYAISRNTDGTTVVSTTGGSSYPRLRDTLRNIQTVQFSDSTVTLQ